MSTSDPTNLVYDVAHDLQTPLTALKAHLSLITTARRTHPKIKVCNELIDSMSLMVSDMLAYARSGSGFDASHLKNFNISECVAEALECVTTVADSCNVHMTQHIEPNITIEGIPEKIEEVVLNLASNSMKYLKPTGRREMSVSLVSNQTQCILTFVDTGIGIPANEIPHVFTRFYRTKPATKHAAGSGLGLAITKKIVELHGGSITIESTEGVGTTVTVTLPRAESAVYHSPPDHPRDG